MEFVLFSLYAVFIVGGALAVIIFGKGRTSRPVRDEGTMFTTAAGHPRMLTPGEMLYNTMGPGSPNWDK